MQAVDAPVMPPVERLLALDTLTLWRVVLAMLAFGWDWEYSQRTGWWFKNPDYSNATTEDDLLCGRVHRAIPNPLSDPAAAWSLMKRERVTVSAHAHSRYWHVPEHTAISGGRWHETPEIALCLYVLAVHSTGTLEPLITPLLERISKEGLDK